MGAISDIVLTSEVKAETSPSSGHRAEPGFRTFIPALSGRVTGLWDLGLGPGALLKNHVSNNCLSLETTLAIDWGLQSFYTNY